MAKKIEATLVGMNYRLTLKTIEQIEQELPVRCQLEREPKNPHDENAIKVLLKFGNWKNLHLGYIAKETAKVIAPAMDAGTFRNKDAWLITVDIDAGRGEMLLRRKPKG